MDPASIKSISTSYGSSRRSTVRSDDSSAPSPRPSAFRFIYDLLGQLRIGFRAFGLCVVNNDRFPVTGRLSKSYISRNYRSKYLLAIKIAQVGCYSGGQVCALVIHGQK